jgi:dCMP deaminase
MERPSLEVCMIKTAHLFAERSVCSRLNVGCVITDHYMTSIEAIGYNGKEKGGPHEPDSEEPGKSGMIHAEENALIKSDYKIKAKKMFITHSPCLGCARKIINADIQTVYFSNLYRDAAPLKLLVERGVNVIYLPVDGNHRRCVGFTNFDQIIRLIREGQRTFNVL